MHPIKKHASGLAKAKLALLLVLGVSAALAGAYAWQRFAAGAGIFDLLAENHQLRAAIANLQAETRIGYAKVVSQTMRDGKLYTRLRFIETAVDDPAQRVLEKEYEIEGDVVHFDALIVRFGDDLVLDGRERAMYLWRRIYGETTAPADGFPIEDPGLEPARYQAITRKLALKHRQLFWQEIWALANDPTRLQAAGIRAIHGSVVYEQLRPGLIYVFKIDNKGNLFPEVIPDF
ncbi:MAG TPA: hypothetical protein P5279_00990 [Anaerohalosphaeraceae bacterium]|nr:hypothetical protein [Anaerohalosphaeraceae bacterium]HRT49041.1 hypothetical protein [Anaerohalosphaeraceae bacterium]HRT85706.1 hypothetical protein [Anaerohalosphaeraceae bacterium]